MHKARYNESRGGGGGSETMGKLIKRTPGSRLLISSLPGSALRTLVESLGKRRDVNKRYQSLARLTLYQKTLT